MRLMLPRGRGSAVDRACRHIALWLTMAVALPGHAAGCGGPLPCHLPEGTYHIALPDPPPARMGALIYLHGYAANGAAALRRDDIVGPALARGYAVLAPDGQTDTLQGSNLDWGVTDGAEWARDDIAFVRAALADATDRFGIDPGRVVLAGYSRGGSMVWDIACRAPDTAAAYAAHAGGFWEPMPASCAGPVRLFHSHGFLDATVPFEGNRIVWYGHPFEMGDIAAGLRLWRSTLGCAPKAGQSVTEAGIWIKRWTDCRSGDLTLELVADGHGRRGDWPARVLDWFEGAAGTE